MQKFIIAALAGALTILPTATIWVNTAAAGWKNP